MAVSPSTRISLPVALSFASTALPIAAIGLVMGVYLPRFFAGHLGLSMVAVGAAITIVRLIDLAVDPLLGMAMDRTTSRWGRYRPWLVVGAPLVMAAVYMLFMADTGVSEGYVIGWLLVLYLGISIVTLSQAAWGAALATDYNDRSRVYGVISAVGVIGAVLILVVQLAVKGTFAESVRAMGWFCIVLLPITVLLCIWISPERIAPKTSGQHASFADYWKLITRPEMMRLILADFVMALGPGTTAALYLFFFHDARGYTGPQTSILLMFYIAAGLAGAIFWSWMAQKLGKHRTLMLTSVCYAFTQSALMIIPKATMSLAIPAMFAVGFVGSAFVLIVRAMVADVADEVRLETGEERAGLLYALVTTTQKIGGAITVGISFTVLGMVGYNASEGAVNTPEAIRGLELCYVFAPIILVFVGGACFIGWKLDAARHGEVRRQLDLRDALAAEAGVLATNSGVTLPDAKA
jgi:GPH family glycoside/pentoside/hexuronide:cation symporter